MASIKHCLNCEKSILVAVSWENLFLPSGLQELCRSCYQELNKVELENCYKCNRYLKSGKICRDCEYWALFDKDPLTRNISVFYYDACLQKLITRWKYRGDYIIGELFERDLKRRFMKTFGKSIEDLVVVPIPLSDERLHERAFNQAEQLARFLPANMLHALLRETSEKQSKKTRSERISTKNPFKALLPINKRVVLVDDIYTTGTTVRHAANTLLEAGAKEVSSFTLIRG